MDASPEVSDLANPTMSYSKASSSQIIAETEDNHENDMPPLPAVDFSPWEPPPTIQTSRALNPEKKQLKTPATLARYKPLRP
jgi:hypothetical protein